MPATAPPIADYVTVRPLVGHSYEIYVGDVRYGYVGLAQPGGKAPISSLPTGLTGVPYTVEERIAIVERVRVLMAGEWDKHAAQQQRLRDLENGLASAEAGPEAEETPATPPAAE